MIDTSFVASAHLQSLKLEALFICGRDKQERFVAGLLNNMPTLVCLNGEAPFGFAESWNRPPGAMIDPIRFEVDLDSISLADELHPTRGALVKMDGLTAIMAGPTNGRHRSFPIHLQECPKPRDIKRGDVAFTRWQIVAGNPDTPVVLFRVDVTSSSSP